MAGEVKRDFDQVDNSLSAGGKRCKREAEQKGNGEDQG